MMKVPKDLFSCASSHLKITRVTPVAIVKVHFVLILYAVVTRNCISD